ncbi:MAG: Rrf2 family transcriptional regulator [bacterium]
MKISTKGRYGLRVLLDIATHQENGPVILRDIAKRQRISEKYLWQVINPMKSAGFVNSSRGAKGGYMLAKGSSEITLLDVISVLEGPVCVVDCVDEPATCDRSSVCVARAVWSRVEDSIKATMKGITLKQLVENEKTLEASVSLSYVI